MKTECKSKITWVELYQYRQSRKQTDLIVILYRKFIIGERGFEMVIFKQKEQTIFFILYCITLVLIEQTFCEVLWDLIMSYLEENC